MKQAKYVQPLDTSRITIAVCEWGGFIVGGAGHEGYCNTGQAAFTDADQCAEWVRSFLRNATARKFGPKK